MGGTVRGKTHKRAKTLCLKTAYFTVAEAQIHLERLKLRNLRGDSRLRIYPCKSCTKRRHREVLHVGHLEVKYESA